MKPRRHFIGMVVGIVLMSCGFQALADRAPSWAVGTFRGSTRKGDQEIEIRIQSDGSATRNIRERGGKTWNALGTLRRGKITFSPDTYFIDRRGNGINVTHVDDSRNRVFLRRVEDDRNDDRWGDRHDNADAIVPLWMVGTFKGYSRQARQDVEIRVTRSGNVTRTLWERGKKRDTTYGNYRDGKIEIRPGGPYYVDRDGSDIRVTQVDDRDNSLKLRRIR